MSGLLTYASNEDLQKQQTELEDAEEAQENEDLQQYLNTLEGYLASEFEDARMWKEGESDIQDTIIDSLNRRNGKYSSEKLSKIKQAGSSDVFIGVLVLNVEPMNLGFMIFILTQKEKELGL